jgi:hypothetical protein
VCADTGYNFLHHLQVYGAFLAHDTQGPNIDRPPTVHEVKKELELRNGMVGIAWVVRLRRGAGVDPWRRIERVVGKIGSGVRKESRVDTTKAKAAIMMVGDNTT